MCKFLPLLGTLLLVPSDSVLAVEVWTGNDVVFAKAGGADWNLAENQDRLTPNVWLTRKSTEGIFNIAEEAGFARSESPVDTEWAFRGSGGNPVDDFSAANFANLFFDTWTSAVTSNPPSSVGVPAVVHLITDDIYVDITFTSWAQGASGRGAFSYMRGSPSAGLSADFDKDGDVDGEDFLIWQSNFPTLDGSGSSNTGDATGDNLVNGEDFLAWQNQFGSGAASRGRAIPEPATIGLVAAVVAGLAAIRRSVDRERQ